MSGPWENYQPPPPEAPGPWTGFQNQSASITQRVAQQFIKPEYISAGESQAGVYVGDYEDSNSPAAVPAYVGPPKVAKTFWEAASAGNQMSVTGLISRGRMPDIVLDPKYAPWYHHLAAGGAQILGDLPVMAAGAEVGAIGGGAVGTAVPAIGNVAGAAIGGGAGAFAMPEAIRSALVEAYSKGEVKSVGDFLDRTAIVLQNTEKAAVVGGFSAGTGYGVKAALGPAVGMAGRWGTSAAVLGSEGAAMTVSPAMLDGRLPEKDDIMNGAILLVGVKAAHMATSRALNVYSKTGIDPNQVLADATKNPEILSDLTKTEPTPEEIVKSAAEVEALGKIEAPTPEEQAAFTAAVEALGDPDIPRAYRPIAARAEADAAFGGANSRETAQEVMDHPFADVPEARVPYNLNLSKITGPDGLMALIAKMDEEYPSGQKRESQAFTAAKAEETAALLATDSSKLSELLRPLDKLAQRDDIIKAVMVQANRDFVDAARAWRGADPTDAAGTQALMLDAMEAAHKAGMITATFKSDGTEIARALQNRNQITELRQQSEAIQKLTDLYGDDPQKFLMAASEIDTPDGVSRLLQTTFKPTPWGKVREYWKLGLLGQFAVGKKLFSDLSLTVAQPLIDEIALIPGEFNGADMSGLRGVARAVGNLAAVRDSLAEMRGQIATEGPSSVLRDIFWADKPGGLMENRQQIGGNLGKAIRISSSELEYITEGFQNLHNRGEAYARAADQAAQEGFNWRTKEFWSKVAEYGMNPSEDVMNIAEKLGERLTFVEEKGAAGKAFDKFIRTNWMTNLVDFVIPFRKATINAVKQNIRLSPLAPLQEGWRADFKADPVTQSRAIAEMALGTGVAALTLYWASTGRISGSGAPDAGTRSVARTGGWQPHSIKIDNEWYAIGKLPGAMLPIMAADVYESWHLMDSGEQDKAVSALQNAFVQGVKEQPFLLGIEQLSNGLENPGGRGHRFVQNLATGMLPLSGNMGNIAAMVDPYQRQVDSILQACQSRVPGLRNLLNPQRDAFGEPVPEPHRIAGISPIKTSEISTDKVRSEALRLSQLPGIDLGVQQAPKNLNIPTHGIAKSQAKIPLDPSQKDVFADVAGHFAYDIMKQQVERPDWDTTPPDIQAKIYATAFAHGRTAGRAAALSDEQRQAEVSRVSDIIQKRLNPELK